MKSLGPNAWALPQPVLIIGTYDKDGQPVSVKRVWYAVKTHNETFCFAEGRIMLLI